MHEIAWGIPGRKAETIGPWTSEPDKAQWVDADTGLDCLIVRNELGALCGYVGVPPDHPYYGLSFRRVDLHAHGGVNYANACDGDEEGGVCHVPQPGRPDDLWWFGFDCAHLFRDVVPVMDEALAQIGSNLFAYYAPGREYRDLAYVKNECARLAAQLAEVAQ